MNKISSLRKKFISYSIFIVFYMVVATSFASNAQVTWDRSPSEGVSGYTVYYGLSSGNYNEEVDCGNVTLCKINDLNEQTSYYIAVRAYDSSKDFSVYSNEVIFRDPPVVIVPTDELIFVSVDSEETGEENGAGINAIDGNPTTIWHTQWGTESPPHPHEIILDLGHNRAVSGFNCLPRQDNAHNGQITTYEFYISVDNENWELVSVGEFEHTTTNHEVMFNVNTARYVKLVATGELNDNPWTSVAELQIVEVTGICSKVGWFRCVF